jgi:hypothetical protein
MLRGDDVVRVLPKSPADGAADCVSIISRGGHDPASLDGKDVRDAPDCYAQFACGYYYAQQRWPQPPNGQVILIYHFVWNRAATW